VIRIRAFGFDDETLLSRFLALAAHERDTQTVLLNPQLARYVKHWGRDGDTAIVAQNETGAVVGMAWARLWTLDNRGFGWVDEQTPELVVAVEPGSQGRGLGTQLIEALKEELRAQPLVGARVSLSVRVDSPAVRLYERLGFRRIEGSQRKNRTGGVSFNMSAPLHETS